MKKETSPQGAASKRANFHLRKLIQDTYHTGAALKSQKGDAICLRCEFDGKHVVGVSGSHTIPFSLLSKIGSKEKGCEGHVFSSSYVINEDGEYASYSTSCRTASAYPLLCESPCELFFSEKGERLLPEVGSDSFFEACGAFCERLALKQKLKARNISSFLVKNWAATKNEVFNSLMAGGVTVEDVSSTCISIGNQLEKMADFQKKALDNKYYGFDSAVEWARRIQAGEKEECCILCWVPESPLLWKTGEMSFISSTGSGEGLAHWLFCFSMGVAIRGKEKEALIFIPVIRRGESETEVNNDESKYLSDGILSERLAKNWGNFKRQFLLGMCAFSLSNEEVWYGDEKKEEIEKMVEDTIGRRAANDGVIEESLMKMFVNPDRSLVEKAIGDKPKLLRMAKNSVSAGRGKLGVRIGLEEWCGDVFE